MVIAGPGVIVAEPQEASQLIVRIAEPFGEPQRLRPDSFHLRERTACMQHGRTQRHAELHLVALTERPAVGACEGAFNPAATLLDERQVLPEGDGGYGERNADRDVAV